MPWTAWAGSAIQPVHARYQFAGSHIELSARFQITLDEAQVRALNDGFSLPFTYEFDLTAPRTLAWWRAVTTLFSPVAKLHYSLSFHALSRHYRVYVGGVYRTFNTLDEALDALGSVSSWNILDGSSVAIDHTPIRGRMKLELDTSQLPAPARVQLMGKEAWQLESGWIDVKPAGTDR